jgi:hypothetical protein
VKAGWPAWMQGPRPSHEVPVCRLSGRRDAYGRGAGRDGSPFGGARAVVRSSSDGLAQRERDRGADGTRLQRETGPQPPIMITVQAVDDLVPLAEGRQWTADQYRDRDAVLRALGVPAFRPPGRRRR